MLMVFKSSTVGRRVFLKGLINFMTENVKLAFARRLI